MTKLQLNDKLSALYKLPKSVINVTKFTSEIIDGKQKDTYETDYILIIDCWNVLMDLAIDNDIWVQPYNNIGFVYVHKREKLNFIDTYYKDHESPKAATRFAIAMALVKLAEDK